MKNIRAAFVTNYYNLHQSALAGEINKRVQTFWLVYTNEDENDLIGRRTCNDPDYVISYQKYHKKCKKIIDSSDVIILGNVPPFIMMRLLYSGKLVFIYSERPLKKGDPKYKWLPRWVKWHMQGRNRSNHYLLSAGAFVSSDYAKYGMFIDRCYKWGYFPRLRQYPSMDHLMRKKSRREIIWCGRLVNWKHPEEVLWIANRLKQDRLDFHVKVIGSGPCEPMMKQYIQNNKLEDVVQMTGFMNPNDVRNNMEQAGIFLFTSDCQEGWGAVLNEAMNSGCAVIASDVVGATPYLLKNGINGFVYHNGNVEDLYVKTKTLLIDPKLQENMGHKAYESILGEWNARVAAERLVEMVADKIYTGEARELFPEGPCSKAQLISDNWYIQKDDS